MLKCLFCKKQTAPREPTGKFRTFVKVEYPNGKIGSRIICEVPCCIDCNGDKKVK